MKKMVQRWMGFLFAKFWRCYEEYEKHRILNQANSAHSSLRIQMPICINGVEKVSIGADVSINPFVHIFGQGGVRIGDRAMIGSGALISSLEHDMTMEPMNQAILMREVIIEEDVWVGAGAIVFPGVKLGRGCIVSANSVVSRDIPPYAIARGIPAKVVAYRRLAEKIEAQA